MGLTPPPIETPVIESAPAVVNKVCGKADCRAGFHPILGTRRGLILTAPGNRDVFHIMVHEHCHAIQAWHGLPFSEPQCTVVHLKAMAGACG